LPGGHADPSTAVITEADDEYVSLTTSWSPERIGRFTAVNCDDIGAADLGAPRLLAEEVADDAFGSANRSDGGRDEPA
jgi:hypothetical protein